MPTYGTLTITATPESGDLGQAVQLAIIVHDAAGNPVDPATLTVTIALPDGTTSSVLIGSLTHNGTGSYGYAYLPPQSGLFVAGAVATVPNAAADTSFAVEAAAPPPTSPISLAEVKKHLNYRSDDDVDDVELEGFIAAAIEAAEFHAGPVAVQTITDTFDGGRSALVLRTIPTGPRFLDSARVLTVTSVVEQVGTVATTLVSGTNFAFNREIGRVTRTTGGYPQPFRGGCDAITVTYQAGWSPLPKSLRLGILDLIRYWWQRSQQASTMAPSGLAGATDYDVSVPTDFSDLPWSVQVKWKPFKRTPAVA